MKINITKKQYQDLMTLISLSNGIFGILGDVMPETDYKKRSKQMDKLENYFLQYASDFGSDVMTEKFDSEIILDGEFYEKEILPIMQDFEDYATHDNLSGDLAWRDFKREHTKEEIEKIAKEHGGYLGVAMYDYEKKYWDEFDEHGLDRLEIKNVKI